MSFTIEHSYPQSKLLPKHCYDSEEEYEEQKAYVEEEKIKFENKNKKIKTASENNKKTTVKQTADAKEIKERVEDGISENEMFFRIPDNDANTYANQIAGISTKNENDRLRTVHGIYADGFWFKFSKMFLLILPLDLAVVLEFLINHARMNGYEKNKGWFYCRVGKMEDELYLNKQKQIRYLNSLKDLGYIDTEKRRLPKLGWTRFIKINFIKIRKDINKEWITRNLRDRFIADQKYLNEMLNSDK